MRRVFVVFAILFLFSGIVHANTVLTALDPDSPGFVSISKGGTSSGTAAAARSALGVQANLGVTIPTPGIFAWPNFTGAPTLPSDSFGFDANNNLNVPGGMIVPGALSAGSVSIGIPLPVTSGGSGANSAPQALVNLGATIAPPTAPTVAVNVAAGNLTGTYYYRITFITASGSTEVGAVSASVSPSAQQVNLTAIPIGPAGVTARGIYRTVTGGGFPYITYLVATISDNTTTTYTDNVADGSLGAAGLTLNSTGGRLYSQQKMGEVNTDAVLFGFGALHLNAGFYNNAFGLNALYSNTTGSDNSAFGYNAMYNNTAGSYNNAYGYNALFANTTGNANNAYGYGALQANTTGGNNNAFGMNALYANTAGSYNNAYGYYALFANTTGGNNNASGYYALYANTTGADNSAFGFGALLLNTTGGNNNAFGFDALYSNTTGSYNNAFGYQAGRYISGGSVSNTTSSNSTYLGTQAYPLANGDTNETVIGYNAVGNGSNTVTLGSSITGLYANSSLILSSPTGASPWALSVGSASIGTTSPTTINNSGVNVPGALSAGSVSIGATGQLSGRVNGVFAVTAYGAVGDGKMMTCAIAGGSAILTNESGYSPTFEASDVEKVVVLPGAGASGATLVTTIASYQNSNQVTLAANAGTSVNGAITFVGTDNSAAIQAAFNAAYIAHSSVLFPANSNNASNGPSIYYTSQAINPLGVTFYGPTGASGPTPGYAFNQSVAIRGAPGKDVFDVPDPCSGPVGSCGSTPTSGWMMPYPSYHVQHLCIIVDDSEDVSSTNFPYRKPGRTCFDVTVPRGNNTSVIQSLVGCEFQPGDAVGQVAGNASQGQAVTITDGTHTLTTWITAVGGAEMGAGNNLWTQATLHDAWTYGVPAGPLTAYISINNLPVTQRIGNCAFAYDAKDYTQYQFYDSLMGCSFDDVSAVPTDNTPVNSVGGFFFQGIASPYRCEWRNDSITATFPLAGVPGLVGNNSGHGIPAWNSSIPYVTGDAVLYSGQTYLATQTSTNQTPSGSSSYWSATSPNNTSWSSSLAYQIGDFVEYNSLFYVAIQASTNQNPLTAAAYWQTANANGTSNGGWWDHNVLDHCAFFGPNPIILYGGNEGEIRETQIEGATSGISLLSSSNVSSEQFPWKWTIDVPEMECSGTSCPSLPTATLRLTGKDHTINHLVAALGSTSIVQWDASACNAQELFVPNALAVNVTGYYNHLTALDFQEGFGGIVNDTGLRGNTIRGNASCVGATVNQQPGRQLVLGSTPQSPPPASISRLAPALELTHDFINGSASAFFRSSEDLWIWSNELVGVWGTNPSSTADSSSDTGSSLALPTNTTDYFMGANNTSWLIGKNIPAAKVRLYFRAKSGAASTSPSINAWIGPYASGGTLVITGYAPPAFAAANTYYTFSVDVDLSAYSGSYFFVSFASPGSTTANLAWMAIRPWKADLPVISLQLSPVTVSALPACTSANQGLNQAVTDSTVNTFGTTVAGGGAYHEPVYCNGTNWVVN